MEMVFRYLSASQAQLTGRCDCVFGDITLTGEKMLCVNRKSQQHVFYGKLH